MKFTDALRFVLAREGGYVNDPDDPGGPTNHGVTQKVYDAYRKDHGLPLRTVRDIAPDEVAHLYDSRYWDPVLGDELLALDGNVALQVFDMAVNAGVGRATKLLQRALHVEEDGVLGPATMRALRGADLVVLRDSYWAEREIFYRSLAAQKPVLGKFLKGWLKRAQMARTVA